MSQLVPHLLLRADDGAPHTATLLRSAGYMVSKIGDDGILEQIADAPHVDGVIIELPAMAAIAAARRIEAWSIHSVAMVVITSSAEAVRRALPSIAVVRPIEIDDDLVSTIDLALVKQQMRLTG
jgi:DNA-binding LytR/AlgR family response regulator